MRYRLAPARHWNPRSMVTEERMQRRRPSCVDRCAKYGYLTWRPPQATAVGGRQGRPPQRCLHSLAVWKTALPLEGHPPEEKSHGTHVFPCTCHQLDTVSSLAQLVNRGCWKHWSAGCSVDTQLCRQPPREANLLAPRLHGYTASADVTTHEFDARR